MLGSGATILAPGRKVASDMTYSEWQAAHGVYSQSDPWTPLPNYPGTPSLPWTSDPGYAPVSTTPNTWQSAMVHAPGTLRMLQMAGTRVRQHGMSGSIQMRQAGWNSMTSEELRLPGMRNVAIRNGSAPPIGPLPYTGPYPLTNSVPAPGLFEIAPGVMSGTGADMIGMIRAGNAPYSYSDMTAETQAWAMWLEQFVEGVTPAQVEIVARRADVLVALAGAVMFACMAAAMDQSMMDPSMMDQAAVGGQPQTDLPIESGWSPRVVGQVSEGNQKTKTTRTVGDFYLQDDYVADSVVSPEVQPYITRQMGSSHVAPCSTLEQIVEEGHKVREAMVAEGYSGADVDAAVDAIVDAAGCAGITLDQAVGALSEAPSLTPEQTACVENIFESYLLEGGGQEAKMSTWKLALGAAVAAALIWNA